LKFTTDSENAAPGPIRRRRTGWTLTVGQQQPDGFSIGLGYQVVLPQRPFSLGGLFRQNMIGTGFSIDDFTGTGFFKALGCSAIGFDFWHYPILSLYRFYTSTYKNFPDGTRGRKKTFE
jgi:hypothetical protein